MKSDTPLPDINVLINNSSFLQRIYNMEKCIYCGLLEQEHRESDKACPIYVLNNKYTVPKKPINVTMSTSKKAINDTTPVPRTIWLHRRILELIAAIQQYVEKGNCNMSIDSWIDELKVNVQEWNK
jgi:hypothetical protein